MKRNRERNETTHDKGIGETRQDKPLNNNEQIYIKYIALMKKGNGTEDVEGEDVEDMHRLSKRQRNK